jgi:trk system potassium uptake protein TrkH
VNFRYVTNQFGLLLLGFGGIMLVLSGLLLVGEWLGAGEGDHGEARLALGLGGLIGSGAGGVSWLATRKSPRHMGRREALLLVAISWLLGALFAALPFYLWGQFADHVEHEFHDYSNCYFEAVSGLTTTGATVLGDIDSLPHSLLLWRAMMQWLGGMGIVVLFVAVLPGLGVGGRKLFRAEAHPQTAEGLQPQIRETARTLLYIYLGLSLAQVALLWVFTAMPLFDAVCHTFTTIATAGFSTRTASIGAYDGVAVYVIVIVFMVLSGINFGLYYQLLRKRWRLVWKDTELRFYLVLLVLACTTAFLAMRWSDTQTIVYTDREVVPYSHGAAASEAIFTGVSIGTTTGYTTSDYNRWPFLAQAVLVVLMFIGGCSGSTAGGLKVIRVWVAFKVMRAEIERVFRPNVVRPVKIGGGTLDEQLKLGTVAYVLGIVVLFALGAGLVQMLEGESCSFTTAAGASLACLCTIGPGLGEVGAVGNYGELTSPTKVLLSLLMVLGRLEVFAIVVMFSPRFWRAD